LFLQYNPRLEELKKFPKHAQGTDFFYKSSSIQTILSAPGSHRIMLETARGLVASHITAGRDFHPALKIVLY